MTLEELHTLLSATEIPVAMDHFLTSQPLPYMVYIIPNDDTFPADNSTYHISPIIQVELYSIKKDQELETTVETALAGFYFTKQEGYLDDEQMYMVTYQFAL